MPDDLSDQDKVLKAQALKQRMELEQDITQFSSSLAQLFAIAPPLKLGPVEKEELNTLSSAIREATSRNQNRARIMELLAKGLGG